MKIKPAIISAYLFALRSVHVDFKRPSTDFDNDHMKRFMAGIYSLFPPALRLELRTPMIKELLLSNSSRAE
ncbi:hypothetical protein E4U38_007700 [Claviceps purpurea]|nr:hypothetical protein E4U38_007700 [Claviceps purpurea]